jgi:hypothetical protein
MSHVREVRVMYPRASVPWRADEIWWVGLKKRVASGWDECSRHESDERTNPYEREAGKPSSFSGISKNAPMRIDDHGHAARTNRRGCRPHGGEA